MLQALERQCESLWKKPRNISCSWTTNLLKDWLMILVFTKGIQRNKRKFVTKFAGICRKAIYICTVTFEYIVWFFQTLKVIWAWNFKLISVKVVQTYKKEQLISFWNFPITLFVVTLKYPKKLQIIIKNFRLNRFADSNGAPITSW